MTPKSVTFIGIDPDQVKAKADAFLAGKNHSAPISGKVEYHQTVITEPRQGVNPDDIPEFAFPATGGPLFIISVLYES